MADGTPTFRPVIYARFAGLPAADEFILDSGADLSLAPAAIARRLGIRPDRERRMMLTGISPREECKVEARVSEVELIVESPAWRIVAPVAFADGNVPLLAGRQGFLERFGIYLDGRHRNTRIEFIDDV